MYPGGGGILGSEGNNRLRFYVPAATFDQFAGGFYKFALLSNMNPGKKNHI
jgi:hypothetical protein